MITIEKYESSITINPQGGYLEQYIHQGEGILYSAQLQGKKRATHVCLPNFGPDASGKLPQHGFGRNVLWQTVTDTPSGETQIRYMANDDDYSGLESTLIYRLRENGLVMQLECLNTRDRPLRLAPGFHPYFALDGVNRDLFIDDQRHDISRLDNSQVLDGERDDLRIKIGRRQFRLQTFNLPKIVIWSENAERYVCIEPTANGNSFLNASGSPQEWLAPGTIQRYSLTLTVESL